MKSFLLGLVLLCSASNAQVPISYQVLRAVGKVYCERLGKNLETGDKITDKDLLKFENTNAHLTVIGAQGRKMVRNTPQSNSSELKALLTDVISLEKKHTASRGQDENTKLASALKKIKTNLASDTILVLGSGKASFASSEVVVNDTAIMETRYRARHENVTRKVSQGAVLDLSKGSLFTPDQDPVKIQLVYYPSRENIFDYPPETLGSFIPMYEDESKIRREADVILHTVGPQKKDQAVSELRKYFEDEYWPVLEENLVLWLMESNLLKP